MTLETAATWDAQNDWDEIDRCGVCYALALAIKKTPAGEWWKCLACGANRAQNYAAWMRREGWVA